MGLLNSVLLLPILSNGVLSCVFHGLKESALRGFIFLPPFIGTYVAGTFSTRAHPIFPVFPSQTMFSAARTVASRVAVRASANNVFAASALRQPQTIRQFAASVGDEEYSCSKISLSEASAETLCAHLLLPFCCRE